MKLSCTFLAGVCLIARADDITPRVGSIEIYGVHKAPVQKIRAAVGVKEGDPLPSPGDAEDRIDKVSGVLASRVQVECCAGRNMILYVGIEERDTPHLEYHAEPEGKDSLPPALLESYHKLLDEVSGSMRGGNADEDLTNGYSLMADPACRELQQSFVVAAAEQLPVLDKVLRNSGDPDQRIAAAYLLQYAPRGPHTTKVMVDALQYALRDPDESVREGALNSLKAVSVGAHLHPEQQIRLEPTWLVELMNSIVWSDRRNASLALVDLTESRDPEALSLLRERALSSVLEMAQWSDLQHALPGFVLAGRLAGLSEGEIKQAWVNGNRRAVVEEAQSPKKHFRIAPKKQG